METALRLTLARDADVAALVGDRIYPQYAAQGADTPHVAYQRSRGPRGHALDGFTGLGRARMVYACNGGTYDEAKAVATAVRRALDDLRGDVDGVMVQALNVVDESDSFSYSVDQERSVHVVLLTFDVFYEEDKPKPLTMRRL
jgi:hypothetical protein